MMTPEAKLTTLGNAFASKEGVPLPHGEGLQFEFPGGCLDLTRHLIDADVMTTLLEHSEAKQLCATRDAMFAGERINTSEDRAVLHVALRGGIQHPIEVDGEDPVGYATKQLDRMLDFADAVRNGKIQASGGVRFTDVINIGIGGSDLGPRMAVEALRASASGPKVHFVANVDGHDFELVTRELDPKTTLCLVASKTFTTLETMMNARTARAWIAEAVGDDQVGAHFAGWEPMPVRGVLRRSRPKTPLDPERRYTRSVCKTPRRAWSSELLQLSSCLALIRALPASVPSMAIGKEFSLG